MLEAIIIGFFIWVILIMLTAPSVPGGNPLNLKGVEPCPPHKWIYVKFVDPIDRKERERMMCDKCKQPPGVG
jgi:hypothetical protein